MAEVLHGMAEAECLLVRALPPHHKPSLPVRNSQEQDMHALLPLPFVR